jgi:hypothetical protein
VSTTVTSASNSETASGDLVLRVCGSRHHGQVVRLKSTKCTIGSGPHCTLRLRARGVRPTHCLVIRGSGGTVIRRWSPDTRLNGRTFTDAELLDGDRLSIGPIELEVVDAGRLDPSDVAPSQHAPLEEPPSPQMPPLGGQDRTMDQLAARLTLANRQGRQRVRRLLEKLRSARREVERLRQAQPERSEWEERLREHSEALDARQNDLELQQKALARERRDWSASVAEAEQRLREDRSRLEADRADLEAQRSRGQWEAEQAAASQPEKAEPPADDEASQQSGPQDVPSENPIDSADVFRRMGAGGLVSVKEQQPSEEPESQPSDVPASSPPLPPPAEVARDTVEESIEHYMARLLERVHASTEGMEGEDYRRQGPRPRQPGPSVSRQSGEPSPRKSPPIDQAEAPPEPEEMSPRAVAPEKHVNLSAMRELANLSAHTAIDHHAQRQARLAGWGRLPVAVLAAGVGVGLMWVWQTTGTNEVAFYASIGSFLVALLWGLRCANLRGPTMFSKSRRFGNRSSGDWTKAGRDAADRGQDLLYGDEPDPQSENSTEGWERELKAMIDAWPQP